MFCFIQKAQFIKDVIDVKPPTAFTWRFFSVKPKKNSLAKKASGEFCVFGHLLYSSTPTPQPARKSSQGMKYRGHSVTRRCQCVFMRASSKY